MKFKTASIAILIGSSITLSGCSNPIEWAEGFLAEKVKYKTFVDCSGSTADGRVATYAGGKLKHADKEGHEDFYIGKINGKKVLVSHGDGLEH